MCTAHFPHLHAAADRRVIPEKGRGGNPPPRIGRPTGAVVISGPHGREPPHGGDTPAGASTPTGPNGAPTGPSGATGGPGAGLESRSVRPPLGDLGELLPLHGHAAGHLGDQRQAVRRK
ncbi:hypothetical protein Ate01nite_27470 [Actinoplanes teichomyceticus]|nr:hypothetical protein Ate01nite_27470 [Actinoplanes teichomyceticus]